MPNITVNVDNKLLKTARKIAVERSTTISALFREFLIDHARGEKIKRQFQAEQLDRLFAASRSSSAGQSRTRESLHVH